MPNKKLKIALIFGGTSEERKVSLSSAAVIRPVLKKKYDVLDVEIDSSSSWFGKLEKNRKQIDVAFLALHGPGGEDGTVQGLLELLLIPYTGSGVLASALAMDKARTKRIVASEGVLVAPHIMITKDNYKAKQGFILKNIGVPIVIKPNQIGSSIGVMIVKDRNQLKAALDNAFQHGDEVMVEKFVSGRELTVPIMGNRKLKPLPVIEIVPKGSSEFFDFQAKYDAKFSDELVPAPIPAKLKNDLQEIALTAHQLLGCRGVSRSDFIVTAKGEIYFLEINTIPGMTSNSLVPKSAASLGVTYAQLLDKLIELAQNKE